MTNSELDDLKRRVQAVESIAEIQKFKAEYALRADLGRGDVLELFADGATLDAGPGFGVCRTADEIAEFYRSLSVNLPFLLHHIYNPLITVVDHENATATWLFRSEAIRADNGEAVVMCGHYYDEYVKVDGEWKYKSLRTRLFYASEPDKGWAKQRWAFPAITQMFPGDHQMP